MSVEPERAAEAVREALAGEGDELRWELTCKRSVGGALTRRRGEAEQSERWIEEALAVRVLRPDGRAALASAAGWDDAGAVARAALADAKRQALPAAPVAEIAEAWSEPTPTPDAERTLPAFGEWLDQVFEAAVQAESRVGELELGRARAARVSTTLYNSKGLELGLAQDLAQLEAEVIGREIGKHAGCLDTLAAARIDEPDLHALGERLGRAVRRQLDGVPRAPSTGGLLLAREAVGEISFRFAPHWLGLGPERAELPELRVAPGLSLAEDSADDEAARSVPADGVGRRLDRLELLRAGRFERPAHSRLPLVRPGIADPPRAGWLRLSWTCPTGSSDEDLVARLGSGLLVERLVTRSVDAATMRWEGLAEGWWVEGGLGKRAVARLPLSLDLPSLLPQLEAAGSRCEPAHASGTIRAVPWLLPELPAAR